MLLFSSAQSPPPPPIIVKIMPPESDVKGLADVLIGALGLTGVMVLIALAMAVAMAAVLFWVRSRSA